MVRSGRPEQGRAHEQLIASVNREKAEKMEDNPIPRLEKNIEDS